MNSYIKIHPDDCVAVALQPLSAGNHISLKDQQMILKENIPQGHKFALCDIPAGSPVIKYGNPIGTAACDILKGTLVHTHNLQTGLGDLLTYTYQKTDTTIPPTEDVSFMGYRRPNGKAGVRNEIWIIPTVGCVSNAATTIAQQAQKFIHGTVEEIVAFPHPYGCSQMGDDQEICLRYRCGFR